MKRLLLVVVVAVLCALVTQSFRPIPINDEVVTTSSYSYVKFMRSLWLKPAVAIKAPVRRLSASIEVSNV